MKASPANDTCAVFPGARVLRELDYRAGPPDALGHLAGRAGTLALDSGGGNTSGRYDYLFADPIACNRHERGAPDQFLAALRPAQWPAEAISCAGLLGYEFGRQLADLPTPPTRAIPGPTAWAGWYDWAIVTDHGLRRRWLSASEQSRPARVREILGLLEAQPNAALQDDFRLATDMLPDAGRDWYVAAFERIQQHIRDGDCYQVNLTRRFSARWSGNLYGAWRRIREQCPVPMGAWLNLGELTVSCHSPESFMRVRGGHVRTEPIKGTRRRDADSRADLALARELLDSAKDRAENLMIVDLLRNDIGQTCRYGSVRVPTLYALESNPSVHHLVSVVSGQLAAGHDAIDLLRTTLPGGSVTGAPKRKSMEIIDCLEPHARDAYCGSFFRLDRAGDLDSNIAIRSLVARGDHLHTWGGGAIVADSDCQAEYEESWIKLERMARVLQEAAG